MAGFTKFEPINVKTKFIKVDLETSEVKAEVIHQGKLIVYISLNIEKDELIQLGTFEPISHLEEYGIDALTIIDTIKDQAKYFVDNKISDVQKYFDTGHI
ncbi:hypothetical protein PAECIP112173_02300 [Paenibacillus sp. JJ-100]|uniref:hypothetical protein n=1 Tax=Paenibacillus sp. JJ-100 TaxID=2974896 RepID=UPI0022FFBCF9|nr:hypothetical protein [Paenibacillus sp. JJ-100]CAI6073797.1 hypothetical protein PAECIP112173_02300 [Paenibacillus sp. JJ-100]